MRFSWKSIAGPAAVLAGASLMVGCAVAPVSNSSISTPVKMPAAPSKVPFKGVVHGGQWKIKGAQIYLLAVSTSGYGTQGTQSDSLITTVVAGVQTGGINSWNYVVTADDGSFSIPAGSYSCTTGQQAYLFSLSGDAIDQTGTANLNTAIGQMAVLGLCNNNSGTISFPNLHASQIVMDEVTTVAAAYALAGFAGDATHIGSSGSAQAIPAVANATLNAAALADVGTGFVPANPAGVTLPSAMIYTLGNILAACVNSQNSSSPGCTKLLDDETYNSVRPGETASAAINMAHQPAANVSDLWSIELSRPAFTGDLTTAPSDFTVAIGYSGGGLNSPTAIAIDYSGNAWIADTLGGTGGGLIELGPQGTALTPTNGYCTTSLNAPSSLALGLIGSQTAWVASLTQGTVEAVGTGDGSCNSVAPPTPAPTCPFTVTGPWCAPSGIASNGNMYVLDQGFKTLEEYDASRNHMAEWPNPSSTTGVAFTSPVALTIDSNGLAWVFDQGSINFGHPAPVAFDDVSGIDINTAANPSFGSTGSQALAIGRGLEWITDTQSDAVYAYTYSSPTASVNGSVAGPAGGIDTPGTVAIDGAGNAWIVNAGGAGSGNISDIAEVSSDGTTALSPSGGYTGNGLIPTRSAPSGIAIDPSGNVWVAIQSNGSSPILQFIGLGAPTVTPVADATADNTLGLMP